MELWLALRLDMAPLEPHLEGCDRFCFFAMFADILLFFANGSSGFARSATLEMADKHEKDCDFPLK
jgi:hypothetical protein